MARPALRYFSPFVTRGGYFQYFFTDFNISTKMTKFQGFLKNSHYRGPACSKILTTESPPTEKFSLPSPRLLIHLAGVAAFRALGRRAGWGGCFSRSGPARRPRTRKAATPAGAPAQGAKSSHPSQVNQQAGTR